MNTSVQSLSYNIENAILANVFENIRVINNRKTMRGFNIDWQQLKLSRVYRLILLLWSLE